MIATNVTLKQLAEFRRYSDRRKKAFANQIQLPKALGSGDGGGDYWISCTSAIANSFKSGNNHFITNKIDQLIDQLKIAKFANTQKMYKRNLEILQTYQHLDLSRWAPTGSLTFLHRPKIILNIKKVPIKVVPHHVFAFDNKGQKMIGGIWFVVWLEGFKPGDLGMYTEALYEYLITVYGTSHKVDPDFCITVDVVIQTGVNYAQLSNKNMAYALGSTLDELNKLLSP